MHQAQKLVRVRQQNQSVYHIDRVLDINLRSMLRREHLPAFWQLVRLESLFIDKNLANIPGYIHLLKFVLVFLILEQQISETGNEELPPVLVEVLADHLHCHGFNVLIVDHKLAAF